MKKIFSKTIYWFSRPLLGLIVFLLDFFGVALSLVMMVLEYVTTQMAGWSFDLTNFLSRKDKEHGR